MADEKLSYLYLLFIQDKSFREMSMVLILSRLTNKSCFKVIKLFMHTILRNMNNPTVVASSSKLQDSLMHHIIMDT